MPSKNVLESIVANWVDSRNMMEDADERLNQIMERE
jgi:hypothetical protein